MQKETINDIKRRLRLRMNGDVSAAMRSRGIVYRMNFGLDAASIREIARHYQPDEALALLLWDESVRECNILATLIFPKECFTIEMAETWLKACHTTELLEQLCFNLLQHQPYAASLANDWIHSTNNLNKTAGYMLFSRLILSHKPVPKLNSLVEKAAKDCLADDFQIQLQAHRFLDRLKWQ
jgi:3-methyladenine DNA glycosylase AlkD